MPLELQPKLLRALQGSRVRPVGGKEETAVDTRVIAATNVDLAEQVALGNFRSDLYYRLNVVEIRLPPLRERRADILGLAYGFLRRVAAATEKHVLGFTPAAAKQLLEYDWPGNVRELENCIRTSVAVTRFDHVQDSELPPRLRQARAHADSTLLPLKQVERAHIERVMHLVAGNKSEAARLLGITRKTLYRKLRDHALEWGAE
jgi:two-component system response regulator HydG